MDKSTTNEPKVRKRRTRIMSADQLNTLKAVIVARMARGEISQQEGKSQLWTLNQGSPGAGILAQRKKRRDERATGQPTNATQLLESIQLRVTQLEAEGIECSVPEFLAEYRTVIQERLAEYAMHRKDGLDIQTWLDLTNRRRLATEAAAMVAGMPTGRTPDRASDSAGTVRRFERKPLPDGSVIVWEAHPDDAPILTG
ncbi:MAG TPA: hypothetical protein VKV73_26285 [Chloroflexota bacterium]|nr:hypothetical protein [Chloroflexota bacterium]